MKRFRTGTGRLDSETLNRHERASDIVLRSPAEPPAWASRWYGPILCKITSSTSDGSGQWIYTVAEVKFSTASSYATVTDGFSSSIVRNLAELSNTTTSHSGVDPTAHDFDLENVPTDSVVAVFVAANGHSSNYTAWFDRPGEFDGSCS